MRGLEGIRIVELASYVAGPACPRILAELGAEVFKVESFSGDDQRTQGAGWGFPNKTEFADPAYDMSSTNKQWISINLKNEKGREFLYRLLAESDILVTNYRDQALHKLGIDYGTIHARFPHIVWAQMRGYGERGPERDSKGFDATSFASRGGVLMSFPQAGEHFEPANFPAGFGDWNAAMALAAGVLAALVRRMKSGEGDKVTVNLYHCACYSMTTAILARQQGTEFPKSRKVAPCPSNNTYRSRDGVWFLMCQPYYDKYYDQLMRMMGREDLVGDQRLNSQSNIIRDGLLAEVVQIFEEGFARRDYAEWEELFRENDVPYQKLFTMDDILADPEAYDNDILRRVSFEGLGEYSILTTPIRLQSVGDPDMYRARPIGYDTRAVMSRFGYSDWEIDELGRQGAVLCYSGEEPPADVFEPIRSICKQPG